MSQSFPSGWHYSHYVRERIVSLRQLYDMTYTDIAKTLKREGFTVHRHGVSACLKSFEARGTLSRRKNPAKPKLLTPEIYAYIDKVPFYVLPTLFL